MCVVVKLITLECNIHVEGIFDLLAYRGQLHTFFFCHGRIIVIFLQRHNINDSLSSTQAPNSS